MGFCKRVVMTLSKAAAVAEINRRGPSLNPRDTHFANVNSRKAVWWLDIPREKLGDRSTSDLHLVLADEGGVVHYLRVPKAWMARNISALALRTDKNVISLELSAVPASLFRDVRPRSGRLDFAPFVVR